jgi:hypothetical protein
LDQFIIIYKNIRLKNKINKMSDIIYKSKLTGEEVKITEMGHGDYTLSNGKKVLQNDFIKNYIPLVPTKTQMDSTKQMVDGVMNNTQNNNVSSNQNNEVMDVDSFFNNPNQYDSLVNKLNNADTSKINNDENNQQTQVYENSAIVMQEKSVDERIQEVRQRNAELINKYGNGSKVVDNGLTEEERQRIEDEKLLGVTPKKSIDPIQQTTQIVNNQSHQNTFLDNFMSSFKSNYDVKLEIELNEKIMQPDFFKLVANNVNGDIIDWYTSKIMDKLLYDPEQIRKTIYNKLYFEIYNEFPKEESEEEETNKELDSSSEVMEIESKNEITDDLKGKEINGIFHIEGKPTKSGKITYKYINEKGEIKDYLPTSAEKKGYKPATKEDLKNE